MSRAWKFSVFWWFTLAVVGLLLNAGICYHNLVTLVNNSDQLVHSQRVLNHLENTLSTVKDAETGQRGFLLAGTKGIPASPTGRPSSKSPPKNVSCANGPPVSRTSKSGCPAWRKPSPPSSRNSPGRSSYTTGMGKKPPR